MGTIGAFDHCGDLSSPDRLVSPVSSLLTPVYSCVRLEIQDNL